jgi:hypothetical protein
MKKGRKFSGCRRGLIENSDGERKLAVGINREKEKEREGTGVDQKGNATKTREKIFSTSYETLPPPVP